MKIWNKKLCKAAATLMALCMCIGTAWTIKAGEALDLTRKGSIQIVLKDKDGSPVSGGSLAAYLVATPQETEGGYEYMGVEGFEDFDFSQSRITTATFAQTVYNHAVSLNLDHLVQPIDNNGMAVFSNLQCGLYLIAQETKSDGYKPISPFLVSVPLKDETDGQWIYNVDAQPKSEAAGNGTVLPDEPDDPDPGTPDPGTPDPGTPDPGTPGDPGNSTPDTPNSGNKPGSSSPDRPDQPNTSTSLSIRLWSWILGVSLIAAGCIVLVIRRKQRSRIVS